MTKTINTTLHDAFMDKVCYKEALNQIVISQCDYDDSVDVIAIEVDKLPYLYEAIKQLLGREWGKTPENLPSASEGISNHVNTLDEGMPLPGVNYGESGIVVVVNDIKVQRGISKRDVLIQQDNDLICVPNEMVNALIAALQQFI